MKFLSLLISYVAAVTYDATERVSDGAVGLNLKNNDHCSTFDGNCHSCVLAGCSP